MDKGKVTRAWVLIALGMLAVFFVSWCIYAGLHFSWRHSEDFNSATAAYWGGVTGGLFDGLISGLATLLAAALAAFVAWRIYKEEYKERRDDQKRRIRLVQSEIRRQLLSTSELLEGPENFLRSFFSSLSIRISPFTAEYEFDQLAKHVEKYLADIQSKYLEDVINRDDGDLEDVSETFEAYIRSFKALKPVYKANVKDLKLCEIELINRFKEYEVRLEDFVKYHDYIFDKSVSGIFFGRIIDYIRISRILYEAVKEVEASLDNRS